MARARPAVLAALLSVGSAAVASEDAGRPLIADWAVPLRDLVSRRVRCALPDGGARITAFDSFRPSRDDCALTPLLCATPAARAEVLRRLDAGTLTFPTPTSVSFSDREGRFEVALEQQGLAVIECADGPHYLAPSGFDTLIEDPTVEYTPAAPEPAVDAGRLLIINPWLRTVRVSSAPEACAWATRLEGPPHTRAPEDVTFSNGVHSMATMFEEPGLPAPVPDVGVRLAVRLEATHGLTPRPCRIQLIGQNGDDPPPWVETRANGHDFRVAPDQYAITVWMPGARRADATAVAGTEVVVPLEPAVGAAGRVVDLTGKPVSGARVSIDGTTVTADARGEFAVDAPKSPQPKLTAWHPAVGVSPTLTATEAGPVTLTLAPRSNARLVLEAPDGSSVWGLLRVDGTLDSALVRSSEVSLAGLAPGRHQLVVITRRWQTLKLDVQIPRAKELRIVKRLTPKPLIEGVVLRGGKPVAGARLKFVRVAEERASWGVAEDRCVSDENGRFSLARSIPGETEVYVGGVRKKVRFPSKDLVIEIP